MDHRDRGWLWVCKDQVLSSAMNSSSEPVRAWARRLLAVEAANRSTSDAQLHEAVRVSEKLRISLAQFVGADGFTALLRRALVLARADVPSLQSAKVTPDGRLEGIQAADAGTEDFPGLHHQIISSPSRALIREIWSKSPSRAPQAPS